MNLRSLENQSVIFGRVNVRYLIWATLEIQAIFWLGNLFEDLQIGLNLLRGLLQW